MAWLGWVGGGLIVLVGLAGLAAVVAPAFSGGAWSPTPMRVIRRLVHLTELRPGEALFDLGAGDGRVVCYVAGASEARVVGVELDPLKAALIRSRIRRRGLDGRAEVVRASFFELDLREADVVFAYLSPASMERLRPKFEQELRSGARVATYRRPISGWTPWRREGELYVYRLPDSLSQRPQAGEPAAQASADSAAP